MLQNGDVTKEVKFVSNDYSNPDTNPKILTTLALTLTGPLDALGSFCAPVFCDFVRNYSCTSLRLEYRGSIHDCGTDGVCYSEH